MSELNSHIYYYELIAIKHCLNQNHHSPSKFEYLHLYLPVVVDLIIISHQTVPIATMVTVSALRIEMITVLYQMLEYYLLVN